MENEINIKRFCVKCGKEFEADRKTHLCSKKCILEEYENRIKNIYLYCCNPILSNEEFEIIGSSGYYQKCHLKCHYKSIKGVINSRTEHIKDLIKEKEGYEKELEIFKEKYEKELIIDEL